MAKEKQRELALRQGLEAQYHHVMGNKDIEVKDPQSRVARLEAEKQDAFDDGCLDAEAKMNVMLERQKDIYEAQLEKAHAKRESITGSSGRGRGGG